MATGRQMKLTGATGEFLVAAELCRMGLIATPFAGNVPHYDIIASGQHGGHLVIQVKTVTRAIWQFNIGQFIEIELDGEYQRPGEPKKEPYPNLQLVMVALSEDGRGSDRFYILSWFDLRDLLSQRHRAYLKSHGGRRPRSPGSLHVSLPESELEPFKEQWAKLLEAVEDT